MSSTVWSGFQGKGLTVRLTFRTELIAIQMLMQLSVTKFLDVEKQSEVKKFSQEDFNRITSNFNFHTLRNKANLKLDILQPTITRMKCVGGKWKKLPANGKIRCQRIKKKHQQKNEKSVEEIPI